jgi:adenylate cyclase
VSADVVGYSRLMGVDETGTLAALRAHRAELIDGKIAGHGGRIVKTMGDGLLLEFPSVVEATQCMVEIQSRMAERNQGVDEDRRIAFRIGVNLGDIIIEGEDILGDGVNIAARLQEMAQPGGVAISGRVHDDVRDRLDTGFTDAGEQSLKNIARPVRVWQWLPGASATAVPKTGDDPLPLPDKPSIAVLPFDNMSGDPEQEYFVDGIVEDVITALSRFRSLFVIARNSSFSYKGTSPDIRDVARDLGVRYVVEGSVRKASNRVRFTAQLIDAISGTHLWADRFEGALDDIFELQDQITEKVVTAVVPEINAQEWERARRKPPTNLDSWDLYLRGLQKFYKVTKAGNAEAKALFLEALERDGSFALAHTGVALACHLDVLDAYGDDPDESMKQGLAAGEKAVALDDSDSITHFALGRFLALTGDGRRAVAEMERAVALNPNYAQAQYGLGFNQLWFGDAANAVPQLDLALRLSPRDPLRWMMMAVKAFALFASEHHEDAETWALRAVHAKSDHFWPRLILAIVLAGDGHLDRAREAVIAARQRYPDLSFDSLDRLMPNFHQPYLQRAKNVLTATGFPD